MPMNTPVLAVSRFARGSICALCVLFAPEVLCQQPQAGQGQDEQAADSALVGRFFPKEMLAVDARLASVHNGLSYKQAAFVAADLAGTGRKEFLVAVFGVAGEAPYAVRVLKKEGDSAVLVSEVGRFMFGGVDPKISSIDVDHSGHPGFVIETRQTHGNREVCFLRWDGASLTPFGTATTDTTSGYAYSALNYAYFLDLDGDGILEIVSTPEFVPPVEAQPDGPKKYRIYRVEGDGYKLSNMFFEDFSEYEPNPYGSYWETFIASEPGTPYLVTVANGDGRAIQPVTSAEIELNGQVIAGPGRVSASSRYFSIPVSVQAKNVIKVTLTGPKDSELFLGVGPAPSSNPQPAQAGKPQQ